MPSVLFVCLGNICRSPMAEICLKQAVLAAGVQGEWEIDSAGTSNYHPGEKPDRRGVATCRKHFPDMGEVTCRGRQITKADFKRFDYILCMDESNLADLKSIEPANSTAEVKLFGTYDPEGDLIISDPYYGHDDGFEYNFQQIKRCCRALLDEN